MELSIRNLKGSPSRDKFKFLHKQKFPDSYWGSDCDFVIIEKWPEPFIVAILDFKKTGDSVTFSEAITYNHFVNLPEPIPVFIVEGTRFEGDNTETHRFNVHRYIQANWKPRHVPTQMEKIADNLTWEQLRRWEGRLRWNRKLERKRKQLMEKTN